MFMSWSDGCRHGMKVTIILLALVIVFAGLYVVSLAPTVSLIARGKLQVVPALKLYRPIPWPFQIRCIELWAEVDPKVDAWLRKAKTTM